MYKYVSELCINNFKYNDIILYYEIFNDTIFYGDRIFDENPP